MAQGAWFGSALPSADEAVLPGLVAAVGGWDGDSSPAAGSRSFGACGGGADPIGAGGGVRGGEAAAPGGVAFAHGHIDDSALQHSLSKWRSSLALLGEC